MYKVSIDDIETSGSLDFEFNDKIKELEGCHVSAEIKLKNLGDFIEAKGHVKGNIILECDRCLNKYEHLLDFDINETFAKKSLMDEYGQELELSSGQFVTDLDGAKEIDIYDLLYQSVILSLPNKKVCGINCNEGMFVSNEDYENHDSRMDIFKNIKISN